MFWAEGQEKYYFTSCKKTASVSLLYCNNVVLCAELQQNTVRMIHDMPDASDRELVSLPPGFFFLTPTTRGFSHFRTSLGKKKTFFTAHSTVTASDAIASQHISESHDAKVTGANY